MLLGQPHVPQILVEIMAGELVPTPHLCPVWVDLVPPEGWEGIDLLVQNAFFEGANKLATLLFGFCTGLFLIEVVEDGILVPGVVGPTDSVGEELVKL